MRAMHFTAALGTLQGIVDVVAQSAAGASLLEKPGRDVTNPCLRHPPTPHWQLQGAVKHRPQTACCLRLSGKKSPSFMWPDVCPAILHATCTVYRSYNLTSPLDQPCFPQTERFSALCRPAIHFSFLAELSLCGFEELRHSNRSRQRDLTENQTIPIAGTAPGHGDKGPAFSRIAPLDFLTALQPRSLDDVAIRRATR